MVFGSDEADGIAHRLGPSGPTDTMNVILRVFWKVVIDHVGDAVNVNAPRRDVSRDQDADRAGPEVFERAEALVL